MWESYLYLITINKYTAVWTHVNVYTVLWHSKQQESRRITHRVFLEMCVCCVYNFFMPFDKLNCHLFLFIHFTGRQECTTFNKTTLSFVKHVYTHTHIFNMCRKIWKSLQLVHNLKHTYKESTNVYNLSTCLLQTFFFLLCITMHVRY